MEYILKKDVVKAALKEKKMKYVDLMVSMINNGYDVAEISLKKWLQPKSTLRPSIDSISAIAQALDLRFDDIVEIDEDTNNNIFGGRIGIRKVPIRGYASCGAPELNEYSGDEAVYFPENLWDKHLYGIIACGDSMSPEIDNGDIVVCNEKEPIRNGDLVHYKLFNEDAIKIYYKDKNDTIKLVPRNQSPCFFTRTIAATDSELLENFKAAKVIRITKADINNRSARLKAVGIIDA